jgi:hypothetical protein
MQKGNRIINGREFLLCGRASSKESAEQHKRSLRDGWTLVRIVKMSDWDFMLYVHGAKSKR